MKRAWDDLVHRVRGMSTLWPGAAGRRQRERDLEDEIRFDLSEETRLLTERGEPADSVTSKAIVTCRRRQRRISDLCP